jgi:rod shape-determining protein MreB and related proteins
MFNLNLFRKRSIAIDLGNTNTLVSDPFKILVAQPSYIVFDKTQKSVKAVGEEAFNMFEKHPDNLRPVKPLKGGVIADYESASTLIGELVKKATKASRSFIDGYDCVIAGIPYNTTEVERRAMKGALEQFNAKNTYLLYEPLAAALGMGLDIREPNGKMIIDMGGGITEMVIISLSGVASFQSLKVSGDSMDSDIQDYFRRRYNLAIGLKTAEQVKIHVGAVREDLIDIPEPISVRGKDMLSGIPVVRKIDHKEICQVLEKSIHSIEQAILHTLEKCPPELAADIYENGIYLTGGNSLLRGLKERIERFIKLPVIVDPTPLLSVGLGIAKTLRDPKQHQSILVN